MKKTSTLVFSLSLVCLLAACGGGSDDKQPAPNPTATPTPRSANPFGRATNTANGTYRGEAATVSTGAGITGSSTIQRVATNDLSTIRINGKDIPLQFPNIHVRSMTSISNSTINRTFFRHYIVSGSNYANSRFGYVNLGGNDSQSQLFSVGNITQNMPTSGNAKYVGSAAVAVNGDVGVAKAHFSANFGQKTLVGSISKEDNGRLDFKPIDISATISGQGFATTGTGSVQSAGHFYGDDARELGGLFSDSSQNASGSFGAIKQ